MNDNDKTTEQLIDELKRLRKENSNLHTQIKSLRQIADQNNHQSLSEPDYDIFHDKYFIDNTINSHSDTFFIFDPSSNKPIRWNKSFTQISGYTDKEIKNMRAPHDFYDEEDLKRAEKKAEEIIKNGEGTIELSLITKSGKKIPYQYHASIIRDEIHNKSYIVSIGHNISEIRKKEKELNKSMEKFHTLVSNIPGVVYICDAQWNFTYISKSSKTIAGYPVNDFITGALTFSTIVHPDDIETLEKRVTHCIERKKPIDIEYRVLDKESNIRWIHDTAKILYDECGELIEFHGVFFDITDRKRAEQDLQEKENLLQVVMENAPNFITILDCNGKVLYLNKAFPGIDKDQMIGSSIYDFIPRENVAKLKKVLHNVFTKNRIQKYESYIPLPDGTKRYILNSVAPVKENNVILSALFMTVDITELKKTTFALDKTAHDLGERVKELNCLYGISRLVDKHDFDQDAIMKGIVELIPTAWQYADISVAQIVLGNCRYHSHNFRETQWNQKSDIYVKDQKKGFLEIGYLEERPDMVEGPFLKEERTLINTITTYLSRIIERITTRKELEIARREAESANYLKSEFLANMSHDIRTPLNAILGFTNILLKTDISGKTLKYVDHIEKSGEVLLSLINDILDFSKIEARQLDIINHSFKLNDMINRIKSIFELLFEQKGLTLIINTSPDIPALIYSDEWRLQQIITNLLSNALKYTSDGMVTIDITYCVISDYIYFSVKDTGIGIDEKYLKMIFFPFSQLKTSEVQKNKGTGLGLAICYNLAQLLGGELTVTSTLKKGSEFSFYINAQTQKAQLETINENHISSANTGTCKEKENALILVAEDNYVNQEILKEEFNNCEKKHRLIFAENGIEAVDLALKEDPDIILMDVQMPELDGNEATKQLRINKYCGAIIMLSAFAMKDEINKSLSAGANEYITKPIDFHKLFEIMDKYL